MRVLAIKGGLQLVHGVVATISVCRLPCLRRFIRSCRSRRFTGRFIFAGNDPGFFFLIPVDVVEGGFHIFEFRIDLHAIFQIAGGFFELPHGLSQGFGQIRQLLGPDNDQGHRQNQNHFRHSDTEHACLLYFAINAFFLKSVTLLGLAGGVKNRARLHCARSKAR